MVAEVRELAISHGMDAVERLVELMADENGRTAMAACEAILNRAYGRPAQSLTVAGDDDSPLFPDKVTVNVVKP